MTEISPQPAEPKSPLGTLGDQQRPVEISTLSFNEDGTVDHHPPPCPLDFRFVYREIPFLAGLKRDGDKTYLAIRADLGILPYTLEYREKRDRLLDCLALLTWTAPGPIMLTKHKRIAYRDKLEIPSALSPVNILAYLTKMLLKAGPYLEFMADPLDLDPQSPGTDEPAAEGPSEAE